MCDILNVNDEWQLHVFLKSTVWLVANTLCMDCESCRHCRACAPADDQGRVWFHFCWEINNLWRRFARCVFFVSYDKRLSQKTFQQVTVEKHRQNEWWLKWVISVCFSALHGIVGAGCHTEVLFMLLATTPVLFPLWQVKVSAVIKTHRIFK